MKQAYVEAYKKTKVRARYRQQWKARHEVKSTSDRDPRTKAKTHTEVRQRDAQRQRDAPTERPGRSFSRNSVAYTENGTGMNLARLATSRHMDPWFSCWILFTMLSCCYTEHVCGRVCVRE